MDPRATRYTVLVIEHEERMRSLFAAILADAGFAVFAACDGLAGLAQLAAQPVDAIICDEQIPHLNGIEFCNRLEHHPDYHKIPIILTSGFAVPSSKTAHYSAYLGKPFDTDDLLATVRSVLGAPQQ